MGLYGAQGGRGRERVFVVWRMEGGTEKVQCNAIYIVLYNTIRLLIHKERLQVSNSYSMVKRCDYFQIGSR